MQPIMPVRYNRVIPSATAQHDLSFVSELSEPPQHLETSSARTDSSSLVETCAPESTSPSINSFRIVGQDESLEFDRDHQGANVSPISHLFGPSPYDLDLDDDLASPPRSTRSYTSDETAHTPRARSPCNRTSHSRHSSLASGNTTFARDVAAFARYVGDSFEAGQPLLYPFSTVTSNGGQDDDLGVGDIADDDDEEGWSGCDLTEFGSDLDGHGVDGIQRSHPMRREAMRKSMGSLRKLTALVKGGSTKQRKAEAEDGRLGSDRRGSFMGWGSRSRPELPMRDSTIPSSASTPVLISSGSSSSFTPSSPSKSFNSTSELTASNHSPDIAVATTYVYLDSNRRQRIEFVPRVVEEELRDGKWQMRREA